MEEHPGRDACKQNTNITAENILLHRMQNVNISSDEEFNEFWSVREIYEDCYSKKKICQRTPAKGRTNSRSHKLSDDSPNYMTDVFVNSEEEIYVKRNTAVWTKG